MFIAPKLQKKMETIDDDRPDELLGAIDVNFFEVKRIRYLLFFLEEKRAHQLENRDKIMVQALLDDIFEWLYEAELEHDELVEKLKSILRKSVWIYAVMKCSRDG